MIHSRGAHVISKSTPEHQGSMETGGNYAKRCILSSPERAAIHHNAGGHHSQRRTIFCPELQNKSNSDRRKQLTTHSGASWRLGSRRTRRPSSACGRRYGRNAGRPCGSWYAFYRTKPFPSSARPRNNQIRRNKKGKKQTTKQHNK